MEKIWGDWEFRETSYETQNIREEGGLPKGKKEPGGKKKTVWETQKSCDRRPENERDLNQKPSKELSIAFTRKKKGKNQEGKIVSRINTYKEMGDPKKTRRTGKAGLLKKETSQHSQGGESSDWGMRKRPEKKEGYLKKCCKKGTPKCRRLTIQSAEVPYKKEPLRRRKVHQGEIKPKVTSESVVQYNTAKYFEKTQ